MAAKALHSKSALASGEDGPGLFLPIMIGQLENEWRLLR